MSGVIDGEQISMLVQGAGVDAVRPILDAYWESNDELVAALQKGIAAGDADDVAKTAHGLKGSSANLGALAVADRAKAIEVAAKAGNLEEVKTLAGMLPADIDAVRAAFEEILGSAG